MWLDCTCHGRILSCHLTVLATGVRPFILYRGRVTRGTAGPRPIAAVSVGPRTFEKTQPAQAFTLFPYPRSAHLAIAIEQSCMRQLGKFQTGSRPFSLLEA